MLFILLSSLILCSTVPCNASFRGSTKIACCKPTIKRGRPQYFTSKEISSNGEEPVPSAIRNAIQARLLFHALEDTYFKLRFCSTGSKPFAIHWATKTAQCNLNKIRLMNPTSLDKHIDAELKKIINRTNKEHLHFK